MFYHSKLTWRQKSPRDFSKTTPQKYIIIISIAIIITITITIITINIAIIVNINIIINTIITSRP